MRIVMIAPFGIRPKGTLLARMLPLARALCRRGHQVAIVAPPVQNPEDAGTRIDYDGVPVIHSALPHLPGPAATLEQSLALLQLARAEGPDLIHLFKPKGYGGLAALAVKPLGLPLVVDTDDWEGPGGWNDLLPYPASAKALFAWQERDLPRRAQAVTVVSRTLESLAWSFGVPAERVFYLPNGADLAGSTSPSLTRGERGRGVRGDLLLYTRFWEFDLHELVAALAAVHQARPTVRLVVVGKGENGEEQRLLDLANRAGLVEMIDYRGWMEPGAIPAVLSSCSVALVPLRDTLINRARGLAKLLELMQAGLAIVAGDVGMAGEYLEHERSGLLVPPGSSAALAQAVVRLIDDDALRIRLSAGAQSRAACFSWDALAPAAERAYAVARASIADHEYFLRMHE